MKTFNVGIDGKEDSMGKRVFLIVIDSMGCGELPDAYKWGDKGSNTLRTIRQSKDFNCPNMVKMGLLSIDGVTDSVPKMSASENLSGIKHVTVAFGSMAPSGVESDNAVISELYNEEPDAAKDSAVRLYNIPTAAFGRLAEVSMGKDTTTGHWEIAGLVSEKPMPTFPDGFPEEFLDEYSKRTDVFKSTTCTTCNYTLVNIKFSVNYFILKSEVYFITE